MDRHGGKVGQLGRILSFELEGNRDELVALVRFSDLVAGKLRVQVERYGIVVDAELADAVLIDFQLDGRHFFRPVKACIHDVRILPHDVERFAGKLGCLLIVLADQAEHDRVIGWRAGRDEPCMRAGIRVLVSDELVELASDIVPDVVSCRDDDHLPVAVFRC